MASSSKRRMIIDSDDSEDEGLLAEIKFAKPSIPLSQQHQSTTRKQSHNASLKPESSDASFDLDSLLSKKSQQKQSGTDLATLEMVLEQEDGNEITSTEQTVPVKDESGEEKTNIKTQVEIFDIFSQYAVKDIDSSLPSAAELARNYLILRRLNDDNQPPTDGYLLRSRKFGCFKLTLGDY